MELRRSYKLCHLCKYSTRCCILFFSITGSSPGIVISFVWVITTVCRKGSTIRRRTPFLAHVRTSLPLLPGSQRSVLRRRNMWISRVVVVPVLLLFPHLRVLLLWRCVTIHRSSYRLCSRV
ncbi:hypothetical protein F5141DRAFT_453587 [Pisolithus sp. B1]|nr:hypothetical protein F5141DRAFT_453587 [Pisolithus sp. B1]